MSEQSNPTCSSQDWLGKHDRDGLMHRSGMKNQDNPHDEFDGPKVVGICNTWSELTRRNRRWRELAKFVKRSANEADGFPLEFPAMFLGEP